jgi:cation diffusion facilitator family transporter
MLSEAFHSVVDTGNQLLMLFGMHRAARPPDAIHPFGHGLQLYFWAFVVAMLIFGLGAGLSTYEGIHKVLAPRPIESVWVNYLVLGLGLAFEGTVWFMALREFRKEKGSRSLLAAVRASKDPTVFTVLFEDSAALLGLLVALLGVFLSERLDMPVLDGVASIEIGLILAATALFLAYECQSLLTGESAHPEVEASIKKIAAGQPGVLRLNEAVTIHFGPQDILATLSLEFEDGLRANDVEAAVSEIERRIKAAHPAVARVFVEAQSFDVHRRRARSTAESGRSES